MVVDGNEHVRGNEFAIEEAREELANDDIVVGFGKERRYPQGSGDHLKNDGVAHLSMRSAQNTMGTKETPE